MWRSARSATPSTRANRSSLTPAAGSSGSVAVPPSAPLLAREPEPGSPRRLGDLRHVRSRMPDGRPVAVRDAPIGGQAVLEGVMMRGVSIWAVACATPEGEIQITSEPIVSWAKRSRILRLPVIRGVVALPSR